MDNKDTLIEKNILIENVESKTANNGSIFFKIKTADQVFSLWKLKKDGTESKAYAGLKMLGLEAIGKTVGILYKEENG